MEEKITRLPERHEKKYWINPVASRVMAATSISITPDQAERFLMLFSKLSKVFFILIIHP